MNAETHCWSFVLFIVFQWSLDLFRRVFSRTRAVRRSFGVVYYPLLSSFFSLRLFVSVYSFSLSTSCSFFQASINHRSFYHRFHEKNNHQWLPLSFALRNLVVIGTSAFDQFNCSCFCKSYVYLLNLFNIQESFIIWRGIFFYFLGNILNRSILYVFKHLYLSYNLYSWN